MDTNESGFGRVASDHDSFQPDTASGAGSYIEDNIAWRSDEKSPTQGALAKVTPLTGVRARARRTSEQDARPIEDVIIGSSRLACALREEIMAYADNSAPVLIVGETGVGKELVAKELHRWGERRDAPFIPVNAGAIPEALASSELFGHRKGAFTGAYADQVGAIAMADGGVLFLDEIGDMPLDIQAHMLRVLDDGLVTRVGSHTPTPVDFRLVAATNVDLKKNVEAGRFRRDLFHRIDVLSISVPPLRERGDDVIEIGEAIIRAFPEPELRRATIMPRAAERLKSYGFPGNVRELRNVLTRAAIRARGGKILPEHITFSETVSGKTPDTVGYDVPKAQDLVARFLVMKALLATEGNVTKAAKLTGRGRSTIHEIKKQLNGDGVASEFKSIASEMRGMIGA